MKVGINYPWHSNTFGNNLFTPGTVADFRETLDRLSPYGITAVRVWLLCQLDRWGHLTSEDETLSFSPPPRGAQHALGEALDRFAALLACCRSIGTTIIPSLLCHDALGDPRRGPGNGGRSAIVTHPEIRERFFTDVLEPFLAVSKSERAPILAWELMNEPHWNITRWLTWRHHAFATEIEPAALCRFLAEGLERIAEAGFESTVGHAMAEDLEHLPTGTLPQFHYYGLPQLWVPERATTNAFIGEMSSCGARCWSRDPTHAPWPMLLGADLGNDGTATRARLELLSRQGYSMALLWPSREAGPGWRKYSPSTLRAVREFVATTPRPGA